MSLDELIDRLSTPLPWGHHLFGIDIPGLNNTAFRIVDFNVDEETVKVKAVGDNHIREHSISDLYEIERDVCSCGDIQCEWHEREEP